MPTAGVLELAGLRKRYGETSALQDLSFTAQPGEILGIAGPNGAGKSTAMRILGGEEAPDDGEIWLDGQEWPLEARRSQVAVVHQEPQLYPTLTVSENLLVGREGSRRRRPHPGDREGRLLAELGLEAYANRSLDTCSLVVWQLTEIARALLRDARVFLFDEPNSALNDQESDQLFGHLLRMREQADVTIMLVSHRLPELVRYCDRVVIIREGRCATALTGERLNAEAIATELVAGTEPVAPPDTGPSAAVTTVEDGSRPVLRLHDWSHPRRAYHVEDFEISVGAVVAFTGVEGSGARELLRSIAGVEPGRGHRTVLDRTPDGARRAPVQYVPADRAISLFPNFSVGSNLVSRHGRPEISGRTGTLDRHRLAARSRDLVERFQIKTASPRTPIGALSGGNQQKVAVAAAISCRPRLLVVEEPTRGVDVRTKAEIYQLLRSWAATGNAVLVYCTEVPEAFEMADSVHVVSRGRLSPAVVVAEQSDVSSLAGALAAFERAGSA